MKHQARTRENRFHKTHKGSELWDLVIGSELRTSDYWLRASGFEHTRAQSFGIWGFGYQRAENGVPEKHPHEGFWGGLDAGPLVCLQPPLVEWNLKPAFEFAVWSLDFGVPESFILPYASSYQRAKFYQSFQVQRW